MKQDVFISYSSNEYEVANIVRTALKANGITFWMAPESIPGGSNYMEVIPTAISESKILVLLLSESAQNSKWVPKEIEQALNNNLIIIPFQIENCKINNMFNFIIGNSQRILAYMSLQDSLKKLVNTIKSILGKENTTISEPTEKIENKNVIKPRVLASDNSESKKILELIALSTPKERKLIEKMQKKGKNAREIQAELSKRR